MKYGIHPQIPGVLVWFAVEAHFNQKKQLRNTKEISLKNIIFITLFCF